MSQRQFDWFTGLACIIAGVCLAAFVLIHPWEQLLGAEIARTWRWRTAHTLHFIGALFAVLGLPGIYFYQRARLGTVGTIGFVLSFIGNALFLGTGMITAFIWPMLATHAPEIVDADGAIFNTGISATAFGLTAIVLSTGYVMFGAAMLRIGVLPRLCIVILMVGAVLGMLPPYPVGRLPWAGLVCGGVLYGAAMVWIGLILLVRRDAVTSKSSFVY